MQLNLMPMLIVCDAEALARIARAGKLWRLHAQFTEAVIPPAVLHAVEQMEAGGVPLPRFDESAWIEVMPPSHAHPEPDWPLSWPQPLRDGLLLAQQLGASRILSDSPAADSWLREQGLERIGSAEVLEWT